MLRPLKFRILKFKESERDLLISKVDMATSAIKMQGPEKMICRRIVHGYYQQNSSAKQFCKVTSGAWRHLISSGKHIWKNEKNRQKWTRPENFDI